MFQEVKAFGRSIYIGDDVKGGQIKQWTGFPIGCRIVEGKKKGETFTIIDAVEKDEVGAEMVSVFACGQLKSALCDRNADGEAIAVKSALLATLCRVTYIGREKVKGFAQPLVNVKVEVDHDKKLVDYQIAEQD